MLGLFQARIQTAYEIKKFRPEALSVMNNFCITLMDAYRWCTIFKHFELSGTHIHRFFPKFARPTQDS